MSFQPSENLKNRTFWGLIIAQFLAGFNDQAIHAAAMFYAIHQGILTEAQAISLMPILFYAPWAIFCTLAGYLADRFSKQYSLVVWKLAEVAIALLALLGFWLGSSHGNPLGAWIVLSCVFMMGTHAAFFAPAKYGAMPEILQGHVLSKGNGILESTTFLAAILGTVTGGLLSFRFNGREEGIGLILLVLALIGAVASLLIAHLPAANPSLRFPWANPFKPLWDNLKVLFRSRPLALAVLGIAFFIFMVSYMRATMYMHGQTRNPHWDEFTTSLVVATVALGVGLGSPLAGYLSGGKTELGLVPVGALGMIAATLFAAAFINATTALIVGLVVIGFFSGFYMVPLYTLLQHRAPKTSKGELVATSNFINVTGAISASLLFFGLVQTCQVTGITPILPQTDAVAEGTLKEIRRKEKNGPVLEVDLEEKGRLITYRAKSQSSPPALPPAEEDLLGLSWLWEKIDPDWQEETVVEFDDNLLEVIGGGVKEGDRIILSLYRQGAVDHFRIRAAGTPLKLVFDNQGLPRFLFLGAAFMTAGILLLLVRKLPDFFVRTLAWLRRLGRFKIKVVGMHNLPTNGPVILATNCNRFETSVQVISASDRYTRFLLVEDRPEPGDGSMLDKLAHQVSLVTLTPGNDGLTERAKACQAAKKSLDEGNLLAVTVEAHGAQATADLLWKELHDAVKAPVVPVFCGALDAGRLPKVEVVFGPLLHEGASLEEVRAGIKQLGEWLRETEGAGLMPLTAKIPGLKKRSPNTDETPR